jgi:hypothetical protein
MAKRRAMDKPDADKPESKSKGYRIPADVAEGLHEWMKGLKRENRKFTIGEILALALELLRRRPRPEQVKLLGHYVVHRMVDIDEEMARIVAQAQTDAEAAKSKPEPSQPSKPKKPRGR